MLEVEVFNHHNIDLKDKTLGHIRTTCPFCSHLRKKENQKSPCLYVDMDEETPYYYCHNCGETGRVHKYKKIKEEEQDTAYRLNEERPEDPLPQSVYKHFEDRGISKETVDRMKIKYIPKMFFIKPQKERGAIAFPYYRFGYIENYKFRSAKKDFMMQKGCNKPFYNIDSIRFTDDVIIQEGEYDVLSSIECGFVYAVSPPNGAGDTSMKWLDETIDTHFKDKKKIILAGDQDDPGRDMHERLASRLGKHRCFVVNWQDCKDGNEFLVKYGKEKYVEAINNAEPYPISGVFPLNKVVSDRLYAEHEFGAQKGKDCHIYSLKEHFSWVKKDLYVFGGYNNSGKSEAFYWMCMLMAVHEGWKSVICAFEDKTADRFYRKLVEIYVGKRLSPAQREYNNQMSRVELVEAIEFVREHFIYIRPEKEFTEESIFDAMGNAIALHGADIACIDPINRIETKENSRKRDDQQLIEFLTNYGYMAADTNVCSCLVNHINKPQLNKDGNPQRPTRYNMLGGQATGNVVDSMMMIYNPEEYSANNYAGRLFIMDKIRDTEIVGVKGEAELHFDFRKRRFLDKVYGKEDMRDGEYDPMLGYNKTIEEMKKENKVEQMFKPIATNNTFDSDDTDEVPF